MKVGVLWRGFTILLIGVILGGVLTLRHLLPPSTQINLGRVKIKGGAGETTVRDILGVQVENQANRTRNRETSPQVPAANREGYLSVPLDDLTPKEERQARREDRKESRQARRNEKKEGG